MFSFKLKVGFCFLRLCIGVLERQASRPQLPFFVLLPTFMANFVFSLRRRYKKCWNEQKVIFAAAFFVVFYDCYLGRQLLVCFLTISSKPGDVTMECTRSIYSDLS